MQLGTGQIKHCFSFVESFLFSTNFASPTFLTLNCSFLTAICAILSLSDIHEVESGLIIGDNERLCEVPVATAVHSSHCRAAAPA